MVRVCPPDQDLRPEAVGAGRHVSSFCNSGAEIRFPVWIPDRDLRADRAKKPSPA
jgi:hypothetical protein